MIIANFDAAESLGAVIGGGTPASTGTGTGFADMIIAATTAEALPAAPGGIAAAPEAVTEPCPEALTKTAVPAPTVVTAAALQLIASLPAATPVPQTPTPDCEASGDTGEQTKGEVEAVPSSATTQDIAVPLPPTHLVASAVLLEADAGELRKVVPPKRVIVSRQAETPVPPLGEGRPAAMAPAVFDLVKPGTSPTIDKPEISVAALVEPRSAPLLLPSEKLTPVTPDRLATFAPVIADAVRDLANLAQDKNVRFNVRPETLGLVAVTIERDAAGPTLRLGVESQAAVHAVRQAETMLNDPRSNAPFVQLTVDLNNSEPRGRSLRMPMIAKRRPDDAAAPVDHRMSPTGSGRYA